jgi:hypothetical protein
MSLEDQEENKPQRDALGRLLPGNTANPAGRPKGQSMKEFWKHRFATMSEEEKIAWVKANKVSGDVIWRMAEGQPKQSLDGGEDENGVPIPILGNLVVSNVQQDNSSPEDNQPQQEN